MHSGGSIPGSEALPHLSKAEREKEGKEGGVVRLVYIGILLPEAGVSMYETFYKIMQAPDLDPDFVKDENDDFHVVAEVRLLQLCRVRVIYLTNDRMEPRLSQMVRPDSIMT